MPDKTKFKILKLFLTLYHTIFTNRKNWQFHFHNWIEKKLPIFEMILGVLALFSLVYTQGFYHEEADLFHFIRYDRWLATTYSVLIIVKLINVRRKDIDYREYIIDIFFLALFIFIIGYRIIFLHDIELNTENEGWQAYTVIVQVAMIMASLVSFSNNRNYWLFFTANSTAMIFGSLIAIIIIGTSLLMLPTSTTTAISWVDALFTTTSAVCVTGLAPFNVSEVLTLRGQIILMVLFQIGGLGIVTLTTFIALSIQKGVKTKEEMIIQDMMESENISSSARILKGIVGITFTIELCGAIGLYFSWLELDLTTSELIFASIFHSISAFCNAGFSIFPEGLQGAAFATDWFSSSIVMILIIVGGLGFRTYREIVSRRKKHRKHFSLQSRLSLQMTAILIVVGTIGIFITDYDYWIEKSGGDILLQTLFTSVTCRTAGFSVVEIGDLSSASVMMMILLMYIGGAPNSTAGGIKVTTVALLFTYFWAQVRGKSTVNIGWNTVQEASIRRAVIAFMVSILISFVCLFILTMSETHLDLRDITFEFFSALGTVGLSRGITADLTVVGKLTISFVMFSGKIGLFTLVSLLGEDEENYEYRYPESSILVG
ncbi:hypothetical protein MY04_0825 [Flammeovirga sp. MY04]|uniref:TrkH family potassium uptake protein n=1 Tax=Flammeovirga sp. MY04 TaxID=1191459 RepID=UPI000826CC00|nr:potassium transporter TrkG [Flammeovirga sp. MY04]ANQ48207.2 hypothetical protein MY04_0825 [Flammeovirga sp. MY04]